MTKAARIGLAAGGVAALSLLALGVVFAQDPGAKGTSYAPVDIKEEFATIMARMKAAKAGVMKQHMDLLAERYDLGNRPAARASPCRAARPSRRACAPSSRRA